MKTHLLSMLDLLSQYKHDRSTLMQTYIIERLELSYNTYDKELQQSIDFLTTKHEKSLVKRMKSR